MLKALIIDDKPANINTLVKLVEMYCPQLSICATCRNIKEGYIAILKLQPALIFLDIEMPDGNGFDLFQRFERLPFEVIFTTAYDQYAVQAFRENALDYLMKPIDIEALQHAVAKAQEKASLVHNNDRLEQYLSQLRTPVPSKVSIPVLDGYLFINHQDIIRCEASGSYSHFFMVDGKKLVVSLRLKECEHMLPEKFFFGYIIPI
ncbi:LytR/AlgR family response regulator transcription factor [Taibaiella koreensis]|uniref:LytR/AlgR family response regulator transcription factor n=1 Tax=Taibaiella koreensis TaxID=1268548 RepID=UPI000E5A0BDB|nr:LytTR family DNA-binding domain-containing protein [Taibaiella koreensis]